MAERPDLIVLGGDYVTWGGPRATSTPAADALAALSAPHGVFAILGNHDDDRDMPAALDGEWLRGAARRAHAPDASAARRSTSSASGTGRARSTDIARVAARRVADDDPARAHADAPVRGRGARRAADAERPHARRPDRPAGRRRRRGARVSDRGGVAAGARTPTAFVSRGVGTVYVPVRLNCPPEVAILTLQPVRQP